MANKTVLLLDERKPSTPAGVSPEELMRQVERIKKSKRFAAAQKRRALLDIFVGHALSNNPKPLTQEVIGAALELRDFDKIKPTVRIAIGRLRDDLKMFQATEGRDDPIIIEVPAGGPYRLQVRKRIGQIVPRSDQASRRFNEGRMLWAQRTPESLRKAVNCFEDAIRLDSNYADPHAALAECYLFMAIWGMAPKKVMPPAKKHAQQAVKINPLSAEAHATLGGILSGYDWDWAKAWKEFDRAVELDPHCITAYCLRAAHQLSVGNIEGAAQDAHLTLKITSSSPSPLVNSHVAKILYAARQYEEAEEILVRIREMMPHFYLVHWQLGMVLASRGDLAPATESLDIAATLSPDNSSITATQAWVQAMSGNADVARALVQVLVADRKQKYIPATDIAMVYGSLDEIEIAFQWLDRACREKALFLSWLSVWPPFELLYRNGRSQVILNKMKLTAPGLRRE